MSTDTVLVTFRVPSWRRDQLRDHAEQLARQRGQYTSLSSVLRMLLDQWAPPVPPMPPDEDEDEKDDLTL